MLLTAILSVKTHFCEQTLLTLCYFLQCQNFCIYTDVKYILVIQYEWDILLSHLVTAYKMNFAVFHLHCF